MLPLCLRCKRRSPGLSPAPSRCDWVLPAAWARSPWDSQERLEPGETATLPAQPCCSAPSQLTAGLPPLGRCLGPQSAPRFVPVPPGRALDRAWVFSRCLCREVEELAGSSGFTLHWVLGWEWGRSAWTPALVDTLGRDCGEAAYFHAFPATLVPLAAQCWAGRVCGSHLTLCRVLPRVPLPEHRSMVGSG